MKILFCGEAFPRAYGVLKGLLPNDEVYRCPGDRVGEAGLKMDVLIPLMHRLEPDLVANTAARLIHQWGVGLEGVDVPAASARGILVCNVPADATANADSTAEHAIFLMMGLARRIHECFAAFREGRWGEPLGEALIGNTALIVGLGRVGKALARKLTALGMKIEAVTRSSDPKAKRELGLLRTGNLSNLHTMAASADFVISTITLTDETRGVLDRKLFDVMKPTAFVVNVSRGPVVNEEDLLEALRSGTIGGAGLDVYTREPVDWNNPLLAMPNVVATPHVAGATRQSYEGIARVLANNVNRIKRGKTPLHCVNLSALGS
jgi:phosphoglycerate dehydrogenase-like enzyme